MDRGIYDIKNVVAVRSKTEKGLNEEIVRAISAEKNEPAWMLEKRLEALKILMRRRILNGVRISARSISIS